MRVEHGVAVVAGVPLVPEPTGRSWGLPADLVAALQEWAQVAARPDVDGVAVSRRGRHLAARLSVALRVPVDYLDPVSGHRIALRAVAPVDHRGLDGTPAGGDSGVASGRVGESTPWATGLGLAVVVAGLVLVTNLALAGPLVAGLGPLGVVVDIAVVAGMTPALWLNRHAPVWRWAVYGTFAGMVATLPALAVAAFP